MGHNAVESVKKLSVDACIEKHLELYDLLSRIRAKGDQKTARPRPRPVKLLLKTIQLALSRQ